MALFAFLVAAMVCVVILGAATSAVRQAKLDQQHQQDMLLLQSAAQLISNEVKSTVVEKTETTNYTYKNNSATTPSSTDTAYSFSAKDANKTGAVSSSTLVGDTFCAAIEALYPGDAAASSTPSNKSFSLKVSANDDSGESFEQEVMVTFMYVASNSGSASSAKEWQFLLSTKGEDERAEHTLFLDFQLSSQNSSGDSTYDSRNRLVTTTAITSYKWTNPYYSSTEEGLGEKDAS